LEVLKVRAENRKPVSLPNPLLLPMALGLSALCHAGTIDIPDDVNARISRAKSEQSAAAAERARRKLDDGAGTSAGTRGGNALGNDGCNIAVGTIVEDNKKIGTSAKRETTVIVTGDIIQAGNNCR
jgi:hypothetical protein